MRVWKRLFAVFLLATVGGGCGGVGTAPVGDSLNDRGSGDLGPDRISRLADSALTEGVGDAPASWDVQRPGEDGGELPPDFGKPCASNSDCASGYCLELDEEQSLCTITCVEECPKDWLCKGIETPPDWTFICVPPKGNACKPCVEDGECLYQGDLCLAIGATGSYCGLDCSDGQPCPPHFSCQAVDRGEGGPAASQCLPDTGSCICTFELNGTARPCVVANEHGKCFGEELCDGPAGWTDCNASIPAAELCDGIDQDCNGKVDDGLPAIPCQITNEWGSCPGTKSCHGEASWVCEAPIPEAELCDGKDNNCNGEVDEGFLTQAELCDSKDNNCNGQVDEGFADTDLDGLADCLDPDDDNDGVVDGEDNCPLLGNPGQEDLDGDKSGDLCDSDIDGDDHLNPLDCAPFVAAIHPGAPELCNGLDDNCNGLIDEGYPDTDKDQLADCVDPDDDGDFDPDLSDCAPLDPAIHAGAAEQCNGFDDNCDGVADEGCPPVAWRLGELQLDGSVTGEGLRLRLRSDGGVTGEVDGEAWLLKLGW